ncbi:hypothetical protein AUCHE_05_02000 [Austwickia chelonae NBRC 105200]|uniref:Uncharacterized protein n=2 Tax=Austwickia TaxID=1184606 RepID=K6VPJ2_9MICO|nr:hypothetical protein AUCHE_05_02000 [Austwickia chelonae NBRC 105200]
MQSPVQHKHLAVYAAGVMTGVGAVAMGVVAVASYALRLMLTPDRDRPDNIEILAVGVDEVTLRANVDTVVPGRYGLWLDRGRGHARVGEIIEHDQEAGTVRRILEGVDSGTLKPGSARWNGYYHGGNPATSLGLKYHEVCVQGPLGHLPAWHVPPEDGVGSDDKWAVLVHGRSAFRTECLRAVPALRRLGWNCLIVGYRNDDDAPASRDRLYALGLSEWADVDAALEYARSRGARRICLAGWSMGGAIVFQTLARSPRADLVTDVILDGPVVDWRDVISHHSRLGGLPEAVARSAPHVLRSRGAKQLIGISRPLDIAEADWSSRADELTHRILLIHSVEDDFVPIGPSRALAEARPDLVTFVEWPTARHTKEWNTDPERWERVVEEFLAEGDGGVPRSS